MADPEFYIKQQSLAHQLHPNPSKFHTQFMYKALIVAIFLVILPLFPSQAPEFINQSLRTRIWELVQLLLVGIAVSYGLFSRKNHQTEKEHCSTTLDNAQSYVSRLLQVSSVFDDDDDESESPSVSDENKVQTWSSQYFRGEPDVVVAQEDSGIDEKQSRFASRATVVDKPLLLPVRSLKSRATLLLPDFSGTDNDDESSGGIGGSLGKKKSSSNYSGSKRFSSNTNKSRNGEVGGSIPLDMELLKEAESVVLRSPIPWRSRSGRMEMKQDQTDDDDDDDDDDGGGGGGVSMYSPPCSMEESDFNRLRSPSKPNHMSVSSSRNTFSSQSSESQPSSVEEVQRKKIYYKSSPPPPAPPPPPPPFYVCKPPPPLVKLNSALSNPPEVIPVRELKTSAWSVPMELINGTDQAGEMQNRANDSRRRTSRVASDDGSLTGKSVRTIRPGEPIHEDIPKPGFLDFEENVVVETDEESENEEEDLSEGGLENGNEDHENEDKEVVSNEVGECDVGKDVDRKADEFIAKFREQIRLQRIESIKRSTGLIAKNSNR